MVCGFYRSGYSYWGLVKNVADMSCQGFRMSLPGVTVNSICSSSSSGIFRVSRCMAQCLFHSLRFFYFGITDFSPESLTTLHLTPIPPSTPLLPSLPETPTTSFPGPSYPRPQPQPQDLYLYMIDRNRDRDGRGRCRYGSWMGWRCVGKGCVDVGDVLGGRRGIARKGGPLFKLSISTFTTSTDNTSPHPWIGHKPLSVPQPLQHPGVSSSSSASFGRGE